MTGHTRSWEGQADTCLDHIWTNCQGRIVNYRNVVHGGSDHNYIEVTVSAKEVVAGGYNVKKRVWKNYNKDRMIESFKRVDWSSIHQETNVDLANSLLEQKILEILNFEAPMRVVQTRTNFRKWISEDTKTAMKDRDVLKDVARRTQDREDWRQYRIARNSCTAAQRTDKSKYLKGEFKKLEEENDSGKIFSLTKKLLGWTTCGPPVILKIGNQTLRKQKDVADAQAKFYYEKVENIKNTIPRVKL